METTSFGSSVFRSKTNESLKCYESMNLGGAWSFLTSIDDQQNHAIYINRQQHSLLEFSKGEIAVIESPDDFTFSLETQVQIEFADSCGKGGRHGY